MAASRRSCLWAAATGAIALAVYVRTLAPGLVDIMDTPMFQFIGRVLGVAHNPGYPLYVLLSYPFSYLPIGSLAYRMNLLSAALGAITVAEVFLIARTLDCGIGISVAAALGLAFGEIFWLQAVIAEVYTLNAAIVAGTLLALLLWGRTRRRRWFFAAIALFSLGLGNHTTIVGLAPGIAAYALLTDARFVLRARTLAATAAILTAGLLQYAFIIVRSRTPGVYVESPATTIGMAFDVMRGRQFNEALFAFDWRTVMMHRVPALVGGGLVPELTIPGFLLALGGAIFLLRRRISEGLLLSLGCAAIFGFAVNYDAPDVDVFLIPVILMLWLCAAVGVERAVRFAAARRPRAANAVVAIALLVPAWQLTRNLAINDLSRRTEAHVYFESLFAALPDRAALVREDFMVDRMVMFKLLGDEAARGRQIQHVNPNAANVQRLWADGFSVFAFQDLTRRLRLAGMDFGYAPYPLRDGRLPDLLSQLTDGTVVAIAVPFVHSAQFVEAGGGSLGSIGSPDGLTGRTPSSSAMVGARGARRGALEHVDLYEATVDLTPNKAIGTTGFSARAAVEVRADQTEAAIRVGGRDIVRTSEGVAVALWDADGTFRRSFVLEAADDFRVPVVMRTLSLSALRGMRPSQPLDARAWADITPMTATGGVMVSVPPDSGVIIDLGRNRPLAPRVADQSSTNVRVNITALDRTAGDVSQSSLVVDPNAYRIDIAVPAGAPAPVSVELALGGIPAHAVARASASGSSAGRATAFSVGAEGLLRTPDRLSEVLLMFRDDQARLIGYGWSPVDADGAGTYRWMTETDAQLLLPLAKPSAHRIRMQAFVEQSAEGAPTTVRLVVNGTALRSQPLFDGWHAYEWALPIASMRKGVNEAVIAVDRLPRRGADGGAPRGLAIADLTVIHAPSAMRRAGE